MPSSKTVQRRLAPRWRFFSQSNDGELYIEGISVSHIAHKYGTPVYVMVEREIRDRLRRFQNAFSYPKLRPQYASKCNSNLEILRMCREEGFDLDASSVGEIILGLLADFTPEQITFTSLFKTEQDILFAAKIGVSAITLDSLEEIRRTERLGQKISQKIKIFLRINPLISLGKYSTKKHKYGIPLHQAKKAINQAIASEYLNLKGLHFHGANITDPRAYYLAARKLLQLAKYSLQKGNRIENIDLGGGFPVQVGSDKKCFQPEDMGIDFSRYFERQCHNIGLAPPTLIFEPGKFIVQNSGIGITKIVSKKKLPFGDVLVVDGSTYSFVPDVIVAHEKYAILPATKMNKPFNKNYDVAGCTCDIIDAIAIKHKFPLLDENDLLLIMDVGAYSSVLATNFNTLKRAPMVLVRENQSLKLIRRRDRYSEMFAPELDILKVADPKELKNYYNLHRTSIDKIWAGNTNGNGKKHDTNS